MTHPVHPGWTRRHWLATCAASAAGTSGAWPAWANDDPTGGDPLGSMQWPGIRRAVAGQAPVRQAPEVLVRGPQFADDAMNVPVLVDARALADVGGGIDHLLLLADRNPVREILRFEPLRSLPVLAFRFRLEQGSPLRAFVRTRDGAWHVGHTWIQAAGGGCTVPGQTRADGSWSRTLHQVQARVFNNVLEGSRRLRLRVMHPMDTGLVAGIPAFYLEQLELRDGTGQALWRLALHEPVSENPLLTFELPSQSGPTWRLIGRDNNGNTLDTQVRA